MLPDGWSLTELDQVAPVIDCKHRTPQYTNEGVPVISPGNIRWGPLSFDDCKRVTQEEYLALMDHCTVNRGDIVFGRNQSVGVASYVDTDELFALGQDTVLIKPDGIDKSYIYCYLQSELIKKQIRKLLGGSTFGRINLSDLRKLLIYTPPLAEQRKIAEVLRTWDHAIETVEALIANSQTQKKALMQELLTGKRRLGGFVSRWETAALVELADKITDGTHSTPEYTETGIPFVSTNNLVPFSDEFDFSSYQKFISEKEHQELTKRCKPEAGNLLISKCGTIGRTQLIRRNIEFSIFVGLALVKLKNNQLMPEFAEQLLNCPSYQHAMQNLAPGGTRATLTLGELAKLQIHYPSSCEEQREICTVLQTLDLKTYKYQSLLKVLAIEKQALMQQLLTGKRRVNVSIEPLIEKEVVNA